MPGGHPGHQRTTPSATSGTATVSRWSASAGSAPSQEPDPAGLAEIAELVERRGVTTVYTETLVDPAVAETVAREAGVETAVLDPLEGLTDESAGEDYLAVMRANLTTLQAGQVCG